MAPSATADPIQVAEKYPPTHSCAFGYGLTPIPRAVATCGWSNQDPYLDMDTGELTSGSEESAGTRQDAPLPGCSFGYGLLPLPRVLLGCAVGTQEPFLQFDSDNVLP